MTLEHSFNSKRFGYLIKKEIYSNLKFFLVALGAVSGLIFIIYLITVFEWSKEMNSFDIPWDGHPYFFAVSFPIIGVLITSLAFRDLLRPHKRYAYLTLPVSNFEKLFSMLLITTVGYTIAFVMFYYVFSTGLNIIGSMMSPSELISFDVTHEVPYKTIKLYLVLQSVFLLGAASFKKYPFLFTMLVIFMVGLIFSITGLLTARVVFGNFFSNEIQNLQPNPGFKEWMEKDFVMYAEFLFWYILAPVCWLITYLKIKEWEV